MVVISCPSKVKPIAFDIQLNRSYSCGNEPDPANISYRSFVLARFKKVAWVSARTGLQIIEKLATYHMPGITLN
jgi:hypothetical protein